MRQGSTAGVLCISLQKVFIQGVLVLLYGAGHEVVAIRLAPLGVQVLVEQLQQHAPQVPALAVLGVSLRLSASDAVHLPPQQLMLGEDLHATTTSATAVLSVQAACGQRCEVMLQREHQVRLRRVQKPGCVAAPEHLTVGTIVMLSVGDVLETEGCTSTLEHHIGRLQAVRRGEKRALPSVLGVSSQGGVG